MNSNDKSETKVQSIQPGASSDQMKKDAKQSDTTETSQKPTNEKSAPGNDDLTGNDDLKGGVSRR